MCFGAPLLAGCVGRLRPAPPARAARCSGTPPATRCARWRRASPRCCRCARSRVLGAAVFTPQAARRHRRDGAARAARPRHHLHLPRLVGGLGARHADARLHRRDLRLALAPSAAWPAARRSARRVGVARACPTACAPPALSLARVARACSRDPRADGDGAGHRAVRRRPVHAVLVLRAVLSARCSAASAAQISCLFVWFGVFGLIGNVLISRYIDRIGAARAVGCRCWC